MLTIGLERAEHTAITAVGTVVLTIGLERTEHVECSSTLSTVLCTSTYAQWPELLVPVGCATVLQRTQSGQKNTAERRICVSDVNKADAF